MTVSGVAVNGSAPGVAPLTERGASPVAGGSPRFAAGVPGRPRLDAGTLADQLHPDPGRVRPPGRGCRPRLGGGPFRADEAAHEEERARRFIMKRPAHRSTVGHMVR